MRKLFGNNKIECPCPAWVPDLVEDIKIIYDRLAFYTNHKKHFVVFEYGTGVFPGKAVSDPVECDRILMSIVMNPPSFKVSPMKDGNFLVGFEGPAYGVVLGDFYRKNKSLLINKVLSGGLLPGEKLLKPESDSPIPVDHYYIGLYARAKLYADAESHVGISLVHDPTTSV